MEAGLSDDEVKELLPHHPPTADKWLRRGTGEEVLRLLTKVRGRHRHSGQTCFEAQCPNERSWLPGHLRQAIDQLRSEAAKFDWSYPGGRSEAIVLEANCQIAEEAGRLDYDASIRRIAEQAGLAATTTCRAQKAIQKSGWIEQLLRVAKVTEAATYRLVVNRSSTHEPQVGLVWVVAGCVPEQTVLNHDVWSRNRVGQAIYELLADAPRSVAEISVGVSSTESWVRRVLKKHAEVGLFEQLSNRNWRRGTAALDEVAQDLGKAGIGARRQERHRREREGFRAYVESRKLWRKSTEPRVRRGVKRRMEKGR
jgi:DNA-binding Lrp family transcriptional regulator